MLYVLRYTPAACYLNFWKTNYIANRSATNDTYIRFNDIIIICFVLHEPIVAFRNQYLNGV